MTAMSAVASLRPDSPALPLYLSQGRECELFETAWRERLPLLLKGPTGCGKTRFVEHMAWRLFRQMDTARRAREVPLITVACHEDLTATDLVGRYLLADDATVWMDGPLTRAVRSGAICYLDEIVEARKDTTVVVHSLTDHRRLLPIEKTGEGHARAHADTAEEEHDDQAKCPLGDRAFGVKRLLLTEREVCA